MALVASGGECGGLWAAGAGAPSGAAPAAPLGLSIAHKLSARGALLSRLEDETGSVPIGDFVVTSALGGQCVRFRQMGYPRPSKTPTVNRGQIHGFSASSRLRMLELVKSVDLAQVRGILFVTLTVPRGEGSWPKIERWRRLWVARFKRRFASSTWGMVWKKEWTKSGEPHLHALVFFLKNCPLLHHFRAWNDSAWANVVKSNNPAHRRVGCNSQFLRSANGVAYYCAKYLSKHQDGLRVETGRIWGVVGSLPMRLVVRHVAKSVGVKVTRALRRLQEKRRSFWLIRDRDEWHRLRPIKLDPEIRQHFDGRGVWSVEDAVSCAQRVGQKLKRVRARVLSNRDVRVWVESEIEKRGRVKRVIEFGGVERHSFAPSMHFVTSSIVDRVIDFFIAQESRALVDDVPF